MAAGNFILLQMGVKYFLSHPQPQVLYDKSYQKSFYKICIYLWRNGDRMDFYVIIVVTPVQYVISEDIRKEGCNVSKLHSVYMYTDQQKCMLEVEFLNNGDINLGPVQELFLLVSGEFQR